MANSPQFVNGTLTLVTGTVIQNTNTTASSLAYSTGASGTHGLYGSTSATAAGLAYSNSSFIEYNDGTGVTGLGLNLKFGINSGGKVTLYDNLTTAGLGIPAILANVSLTGQSISLGPTNLLASPATGTYRANIYMVDTTAGTSGTVTATIGYTDVAQPQTQTTATLTFGTGGAFVQSTFIFQAQSGTAITYSTTVTSALGSPAYAVYISLERLN